MRKNIETAMDWFIRVKVGKVTDIDIERNVAMVRFSDVPGDEHEVIACHPAANTGDSSSSDAGQHHPAWGIWSYPSVNSVVLVYRIQSQIPFIIASIPPKYGYDEWKEVNGMNMNRPPIAVADQRREDNDKSPPISDNLLKWGEVFLRSVGLGDIMIDYKGNVIIDSSKQVTIRIGDRDSDNKISNPDVEVQFGRILDTGGTEKTYGGKKIKAEITYGSAFIRILDDGQVNINGHLTVDT